MKVDLKGLIIVALGLITGFAIAEVATADRNKSDPELTRTLNGADWWITTIRHHFDGGVAEAVCADVGFGINTMVWCDGRAYIANRASATNADAGTLQVEEMVPVGAYEKYGVGLTGANKKQICVRQDRLQDDAGSVVRCSTQRRY